MSLASVATPPDLSDPVGAVYTEGGFSGQMCTNGTGIDVCNSVLPDLVSDRAACIGSRGHYLLAVPPCELGPFHTKVLHRVSSVIWGYFV